MSESNYVSIALNIIHDASLLNLMNSSRVWALSCHVFSCQAILHCVTNSNVVVLILIFTFNPYILFRVKFDHPPFFFLSFFLSFFFLTIWEQLKSNLDRLFLMWPTVYTIGNKMLFCLSSWFYRCKCSSLICVIKQIPNHHSNMFAVFIIFYKMISWIIK